MTKAPAVDLGPDRTGTSLAPQQSSTPSAAPVVALDRVDIQPLDLIAALQILIAEVRTGLIASFGPDFAFTEVVVPNAAQAPQLVLQLFLRALPDDSTEDLSAWAASVTRVEADMTAALDRGVEAVTAWRDVPQPVIDGVKYTRDIVLAALAGETANADWLRPEWLGLAPQLERYRRRRRAVRRGVFNPDHVDGGRGADDADKP